jgi:hypothetical protein
MKPLIFSFRLFMVCIISAFFFMQAHAQLAMQEYMYDDAGNRIIRRIVPLAKQAQHDSIAQADTSSAQHQQTASALQDADNSNYGQTADIQYSGTLGDYTINVYPNPTPGLLKVQLAEYTNKLKAEIRVYDLQNKLLLTKAIRSEFTQMDFSALPEGIYLMNIHMDSVLSPWKIIKY